MYGPIPIKIKGIVVEKELMAYSSYVSVVGNNQIEKIICIVYAYKLDTDEELRIKKIINNQVNIGDEVTCAGSFGELQVWDNGGYPGEFYLLMHDLIIHE